MNAEISTSKPKVHFHFLDALRGIAALWVVLFHIEPDDRLVHLSPFLPKWFTVVVFERGHLGVPIFFVLSGFVIAHSLRKAKIDFSYFGRFALRRLTRLTPPYYASIVVVLGFAFISSQAKGEAFAPMYKPLSLQRLLAHLVYLQDIFGLENINDVYWTLCLEVQFYLVFCALLGLAQWLEHSRNLPYARVAVFAPAAIVAALFPLGVFPDTGRPVIFLPLWHTFLLGVFAYWSWKNSWKPIFCYSYGTLLMAAAIASSTRSMFTSASVIVALILLEVGRANRMQDWLSWRWLQFLGLISYSLYLTHTPIVGATFFLGYKLLNHSVWSEILCLIAAILSCVVFAALMWHLIEKPSIQWSHKVKLVNSPETYQITS
ncbi:MAG TPA: acyltransferase [Cyanobacteria bacterium UBA8803]|nr:acyltransferase [Cyanobacteria bacterium UBA9273]HBL57850.1 acyltransferase [Cyanobacteria bacterium UBA8803]